MTYRLYARRGWGSVLVECQLVWYGLPHELVEVGDLFEDAGARDGLAPVNPIAQIPTLVLPDGHVMTESAAITLHLADAAGTDAGQAAKPLVPPVGTTERPAFLRWLVYIVANIYPTFTYVDDPSRFVDDADAQKQFAASVSAYRERLWRYVEAEAGAPWFLGDRFSAIDVFLGAMAHWEPGPDWFRFNTPKITAIARAAKAEPVVGPVLTRNYEGIAGI